MEEIKLKDFITLVDGRRYCIVKQQTIMKRHFAYALTVPDKIADIPKAEPKILTFDFLDNGKIGTREYKEAEEQYQLVMRRLLT